MQADPRAESTLERYRTRLAQYGKDPATLGWRDGSQEVRFAAIRSWIGPSMNSSLLDIGCGFGDLLTYFRQTGWQGKYLGVDLVPEILDLAREAHRTDSDAEFIAGDILSSDLRLQVHDTVIACGLCNHNRGNDHPTFVSNLVDRALNLARDRVIIDFLSTTSDRCREDLYFMQPSEATKLAASKGRRFAIDHTYMPFEFMMVLRPQNEVACGLPYFSKP